MTGEPLFRIVFSPSSAAFNENSAVSAAPQIQDRQSAHKISRRHESKGKPVEIVGEFAPNDDFAVATRNEDQELRDILNEGFKLLMADPYWQELQAKYLK